MKATAIGMLIVLAFMLSIGSMAQLQQSGGPGSSVSVTNASLPVTESGTWTIQPGNTANTTPWLASISQGGNTATVSAGGALKVDNSAVTQPVSGTFWQATQPVSGTVNTVPKTACGNTVASQALAAVPTSSTAVFSSTTCVITVVLNNTNGTAATVTVTDNSGTPINDVLTFSIPGNSQLIQPLSGVAFTSGVKWTASTSGVTGAVLGYQ